MQIGIGDSLPVVRPSPKILRDFPVVKASVQLSPPPPVSWSDLTKEEQRAVWQQAYPEIQFVDGKPGKTVFRQLLEEVLFFFSPLQPQLKYILHGNNAELDLVSPLNPVSQSHPLQNASFHDPDVSIGENVFTISSHGIFDNQSGGSLAYDDRSGIWRVISSHDMASMILSSSCFDKGMPIFAHICEAGRDTSYWQAVANATGSPVIAYTGSATFYALEGGAGAGLDLDGSQEHWLIIYPDVQPLVGTVVYDGQPVTIIREMTPYVSAWGTSSFAPCYMLFMPDGSVKPVAKDDPRLSYINMMPSYYGLGWIGSADYNGRPVKIVRTVEGSEHIGLEADVGYIVYDYQSTMSEHGFSVIAKDNTALSNVLLSNYIITNTEAQSSIGTATYHGYEVRVVRKDQPVYENGFNSPGYHDTYIIQTSEGVILKARDDDLENLGLVQE